MPQEILGEVTKAFPNVFKKKTEYRATGVTFFNLEIDAGTQLDLFRCAQKSEGMKRIFQNVDELSARYGKHIVYLGSSFLAMNTEAHMGDRAVKPVRTEVMFKGETSRRRLNIPMLGEVT